MGETGRASSASGAARAVRLLVGLTVAAAPLRAIAGPAARPAAPAPDADRALFDDVCLVCHDDPEPPRPDFAAAIDRPLATKALKALADHVMPPPTSSVSASLTPDQRARLLTYLCRVSGREDDACRRIVAFETSLPLVRSGGAILGALRRGGGRAVSDQHEGMIWAASSASLQVRVRDAAVVSRALLVAIDACRGPVSPIVPPFPGRLPTELTGDALAACVDRYLAIATLPPAGVRR